MTEIARAIVVASILLGGALIVRGTFGTDRYDLFSAGGGAVYRLDRLTGGVSICDRLLCRPLPVFVPKAGSTPSVPAPPDGSAPAPLDGPGPERKPSVQDT
jgi:hypothetical protein